MSRYIEQEVTDIIRNPEEGETVSLLLGVSGDMDSVQKQLQAVGAETERLPYDTLQVEIPEVKVGIICEMDDLKSIEVEGTIETLEAGNADYPADLTL